VTASTLVITIIAVAAGTVVTAATLRVSWRLAGIYLIRRAGPRPLRATRHRLWRDPGQAADIDFAAGPGGPESTPVPPFRFVEEHGTGSQPCVSVTDARGHRWRVKWGDEVRSETFAVRLAWACGYFAEVTHFVPAGRIEGVTGLGRADHHIEADGSFVNARFEADEPHVKKMFEEHSWAWDDNPFVGTPELNGLKIVVMLLSNWDTKDRRDVARGSNTAIFEYRRSRWRREAHYLITDWGGAMGRWGSTIVTRGRWDADGFEAQTPRFVTGVQDGLVRFGYAGQRTADVAEGIRVSDVAWICRYLGALTDAHVATALHASGASDDEAVRFTRALRQRIDQLQRVAATGEFHAVAWPPDSAIDDQPPQADRRG
jgi:hypothetical protein